MLNEKTMVKPVEVFQGFPIYRRKGDLAKDAAGSIMSGEFSKNKQKSDFKSPSEAPKAGGVRSLSLD